MDEIKDHKPKGLKGPWYPPTCTSCKRELSVFWSQGYRGSESIPFVTPYISPCRHCAETERLRGMKAAIETLIEEREG
jgi:hypothetical protein